MPRFRWLLLLENFCSVVAAVRDLHNEVDFKWLPELFDAIVSLTGTHRLCRRKAAATKKAKSADNKSKPAMTEENEEKAPAYQEIVKASDQLDETDFASLDLFHVEVRSSDQPDKEKIVCHMKESTAKVVFGVIIVLAIALSWIGATQFANKTYTKSFKAPYFTTWYTTCFMIVVFPSFTVPQLGKKRPWRFKTFYRESAKIFGPQGVCLISLVRYILPFCILWLASNYLYIRALNALNPADVTALFSSVSAFVYVFSIALLKEKFFATRLTAVLLSIGGIVLFASTYGFKGPTVIGIVLTVLAAAASAMYQVMFKRVVGNASSSQVALFLSLLGFLNALLFWLIILPLHFTRYERIDWSDMPWKFLNGSGLLTLVFNYLVNFGIAFTSPLFIALGVMLGTPLNAVADYIFNNTDFGLYKIIASILILAGFCLMLITNEALSRFERKLMCKKDDVGPEEGAIADDDAMLGAVKEHGSGQA